MLFKRFLSTETLFIIHRNAFYLSKRFLFIETPFIAAFRYYIEAQLNTAGRFSNAITELATQD